MKHKALALAVATTSVVLLSACQALAKDAKDSPKTIQLPNDPNALPDGANSDPIKLGIMQGFPPPNDKIVTLANAQSFPYIRWAFSNVRSLTTTKVVPASQGERYQFEYDLDNAIANIKFVPKFVPKSEQVPMSVEDAFVRKVYGDGIIVLHKGKIVFEKYYNSALKPTGTHLLMSVTKSYTGTLAAQLIYEGVIDDKKPVTDYVPELKNSAWGDATVRQVLDMTASLQYSEDYADPNAHIVAFGKAVTPSMQGKDYTGPKNTYEFLQTVKKDNHPHDTKHEYKTVNTDVMAWIIARATGKGVDELFSERFLVPMGASVDGYMQTDGAGIPFAGGGMSLNLKDMAMFGEMMRNNGRFNGKQIIAPQVVADTMRGGDREKFAKSGDYPNLDGWSYRNMWWVSHNANGAYMARGIHGQAIYIDPTAQMVIVRFASNPVASNAHNDPWSLPAYQAVADYLMKK
ncbi:6-aminohexanoate-dimer hydrolase [Moraxella lacunata]|uniref:6-aminohexanoate-dimer hydrolase n=1 Tax=Moraxella lacunata TaxID=477 RepID=A0A378T6D0_MORLA|nr:serine hydrolase [Moraxella lacunata]STZ56180.1 6-aminohexanoate-dimer hydrolase [Moraxella lacunata]